MDRKSALNDEQKENLLNIIHLQLDSLLVKCRNNPKDPTLLSSLNLIINNLQNTLNKLSKDNIFYISKAEFKDIKLGLLKINILSTGDLTVDSQWKRYMKTEEDPKTALVKAINFLADTGYVSLDILSNIAERYNIKFDSKKDRITGKVPWSIRGEYKSLLSQLSPNQLDAITRGLLNEGEYETNLNKLVVDKTLSKDVQDLQKLFLAPANGAEGTIQCISSLLTEEGRELFLTGLKNITSTPKVLIGTFNVFWNRLDSMQQLTVLAAIVLDPMNFLGILSNFSKNLKYIEMTSKGTKIANIVIPLTIAHIENIGDKTSE